jgi:hypothetical protein
MLKFFTSLFLVAATLVSGLSSFTSTITASASLANPIDCTFAGMYKDRTRRDSPCRACPVDFVCKIVINAKGDRVSPELPGKDGQTNSEVVPCPAGFSTKGFTFHPTLAILLVKDQDGFVVGTMATDPSMCKKPDFKCPAESPILVQDVSGEVKCFANCPANLASIIYEGTQTCGIKCRDDELSDLVKCFKKCPAGEILSSRINQEQKCVSICTITSIQGQVVNENGSCVCPAGKSIILDSINSNTGKCGVPVPCPIEGQIKSGEGVCFCEPPRTLSSDKKSCNLPVEPCSKNTYGTSQPNCKPCPDNSKSVGGQAITMDDCVFDPCTVVGQSRLAGKCACPVGKVVSEDKICITPEVPCTVQGQIKTFSNTCECPLNKILSEDGKSCIAPPVPCGINTYGEFKPNCKRCPEGSRAAAGTALTVGDCNYDPCSIIGQSRVEGICRCPSGTQISSSGFICEKPSTPCPAKGQIKTADGECFCLAPNILNSAKNACETPPAACPANSYGESQPNCTPCPTDSKSVVGARIVQDCIYNPCPAAGQIRKEGVCVCTLPSALNTSGTICEIPTVLCKENFYGISEPNCKPCPANFTSEAGNALLGKDCKADKCVISSQIRYNDGICYCPSETVASIVVASNGTKSCGVCPPNTTSVITGQDTNTQNLVRCDAIVQAVQQENKSGPGFCGEWWALACAAGAIGIGCLIGWCNGGKSEEKKPEYTTTPVYNPTPVITTVENKVVIKTTKERCTGTNAELIDRVIADGKAADPNSGLPNTSTRIGQWHSDKNGEYVWIKTESNGKKATSFSTTVINGQYNTNESLDCLMRRYAALNKVEFGSIAYVNKLARLRPTSMPNKNILHGFNSNPKIMAECLNLTQLLVDMLGYGDTYGGEFKYTVFQNGQIVGTYTNEEEAKTAAKRIAPTRKVANKNFGDFGVNYGNKYTPSNSNQNEFDSNQTFKPEDIQFNNTNPISDQFLTTEGFLNLFGGIKVQAFESEQTNETYISLDHNLMVDEGDYQGGSSELGALALEVLKEEEVYNDEEGSEEQGVYGNSGQLALTGNNNDDYGSYTSISLAQKDIYDQYGNINTVNAVSKDSDLSDNFNQSCASGSFGSFNPFGILISPIKVNAVITNDGMEFVNNELKGNTFELPKVDCNNPLSFFSQSDTDTTWSISSLNNSIDTSFNFSGDMSFGELTSSLKDQGYSFSSSDFEQSGDVFALSILPGFGSQSNLCGPFDFSCATNNSNVQGSDGDSGFGFSPNADNYIGRNDGNGVQYIQPCGPYYGGDEQCNAQTNADGLRQQQQEAAFGYNCDANYVPGVTECQGSGSKTNDYSNNYTDYRPNLPSFNNNYVGTTQIPTYNGDYSQPDLGQNFYYGRKDEINLPKYGEPDQDNSEITTGTTIPEGNFSPRTDIPLEPRF